MSQIEATLSSSPELNAMLPRVTPGLVVTRPGRAARYWRRALWPEWARSPWPRLAT